MNGYCELYIFKNCKILKGKNFKVESIRNYLSSLDTLNNKDVSFGTPIAISGQWMKHGLKLEYVIDFKDTTQENYKYKQALSCLYEAWANYNYLMAQNIDTGTQAGVPTKLYTARVFYFITNIKWNGENSVKLELEMDVINTLVDNYPTGTTPLTLSPKTMILRQHKNRFSTYIGYTKYPEIDFYTENINPLLLKKSEQVLDEPNTANEEEASFYLIYRSRSTDNDAPIDIFLCMDENKTISGSSAGFYGHKDPVANLKTFQGWCIYGADTGSGSINNVGAKVIIPKTRTSDTPITLEITQAGQMILITRNEIYVGILTSSEFQVSSYYQAPVFKRFRDIEFQGVYAVRKSGTISTASALTTSIVLGYSIDTSFPSVSSSQEIGSITDIDRTDPKLLKILKLPYAPCDLSWTGASLHLPAGWGVQEGSDGFPTLVKYVSQNTTEAFHHLLRFDMQQGSQPYRKFRTRIIEDFGKDVNRNINNETKLLHSDYYQQKFVYDSFTYTFRGEFYNTHEIIFSPYDYLEADFFVSATMNSKMMFKFTQEKRPLMKFDTQDYSGLVYVARNNELPIFNSAYLNYIRTGYNYDIKTKNRQLRNNIVSAGISIAGTIAGAMMGGPMGAFAVASFGTGVVKSSYDAISQTAQAEQNIEQKLRSAEIQGLSVIGSDDVDLLTEYTDKNRAKLIVYECSDKMKQCLFDLFYYTGYIANVQGMPDTSSRLWFNFVQAEVVFENEQRFPSELIEELKKKYREGITYLHRARVYDYENEEYVYKWDFEQVKENWEISLIPNVSVISVSEPSQASAGIEFLIMPENLPSSDLVARLTNSGKLTWRKRRKDTLLEVEKITGLDTFTLKGNLSPKAMDVRVGSTIKKEISFIDYAEGDYYWTIEFSESTSSGYNQSLIYPLLTHQVFVY